MINSACHKGSPAMMRSGLRHSRSHPITNTTIRYILVKPLPGNRQQGRLTAGNLCLRCALGKGGITTTKREGDGATPVGIFALRKLWFRADRGIRPVCGLPMQAAQRSDGWCDATGHRRYNRPVTLPFGPSHERLWRADHVYDVIIEIGWNDRPAIPGRGSAIFFHLARPGYTPTEGCVAISARDMRKLLPLIGPSTRIDIR
jgi:L,D-peptidoglycan transpeptidase YkuD (ErfK/YbiS/YcfS/YnhG family)